MRNIEELRNYFLGKDPQLKETLADNSLRLIGIPGREFVLKAELYKRLKELNDALTKETEDRISADETLQGNIDAEARTRREADEELGRGLAQEIQDRKDSDNLLAGDIDTLDRTVDAIIDWANTADFVYVDDLNTALSNYYTKEQVNQLISVIPRFSIEVVEELPIEDISTTTIYLLAKEDGSGNDYYDEYIYIDNEWELIGSTQVDLSNYYTKTEADAQFAEDSEMQFVESMLQLVNDKTSSVVGGTFTATTDDLANSYTAAYPNFSSIKFQVLEDEMILVSGKGGDTANTRLWAFYDDNGDIIAKADADAVLDDIELQTPADGYLIMNFTDATTYPYSIVSTRYKTMEEVDTEIKGKVSKSGDTMTGALVNTSSVTIGARAQNSTVGTRSLVVGTNNIASGARSVAEGQGTSATANNAHAEGNGTTASGISSHAEGEDCVASGEDTHAEGYSTFATGSYSHAEGVNNVASGTMSHAEGFYTTAQRRSQHVEGENNILDTTGADVDAKGDYIHIAGNGTSTSNQSNAHTLDWSGNAWFAGDVYVGSTSGTNKDAGSKKLATEDVFTGTDGLVAGAKGLVPAPTTADDGKFLCADGTWQQGGGGTTITYGNTDLTPGVSPLAEGEFYFYYL